MLESMEAIEELSQLSDWMRQASALLSIKTVALSSGSSRRPSTFLNVVALGNTGAGNSAVLNSLIGHPVLPTGQRGATRAPICVELTRDGSLSRTSIILHSDSALRHTLQDRLSKSSGKSRDEINLKLRTSTATSLKLINLPGLDKGNLDDALGVYVELSNAILLVVIPASQAPEVASTNTTRIAKELDGECTRTVGVISKIDQASSEQEVLAAVQALLLNQGPRSTSDTPWVALIGEWVAIASAQSGSVGADNSLETAWRAENESLKSILTGAPQRKLGRLALVETLAQHIRNRMKIRLPNLFLGLEQKQDELYTLGEQMVNSTKRTRTSALEFEDKFLHHNTSRVERHHPWLMISSHGAAQQKQYFYSISEKKIYTTEIPRLFNKRVLASAYGWLVLVDPYTNDCQLWNPVSMQNIVLPMLDNSSIYNRCVISKPPTDPGCRILFNSSSTLVRAFLEIGDDAFAIEIGEYDDGNCLATVGSFKGKMYGIVSLSNQFVTLRFILGNVELTPMMMEGGQPWRIPRTSRTTFRKEYLIESPRGELLLVKQMFPRPYFYKDFYFQVFLLDINQKKCVELEDIGNQSIFLDHLTEEGVNGSVCCYSNEIQPNSIYYSTPDSGDLYVYDLNDGGKTLLLECPAAWRTRPMNNWVEFGFLNDMFATQILGPKKN